MTRKKGELLQGTLDMLILKTLTAGPMHGYSIVRRLQQVSEDALVVEEGSLYPALYRMAAKGWVEAEWGTSENNRRAKFYRLTTSGKRQLEDEVAFWERFSTAAAKVLQLTPSGG